MSIILESIHPNLGKIKDADKIAIIESIESYTQDKIAKVEEEYANKFSILTESISTTFVDLVEKTVDDTAREVMEARTVKTLTESLNKVKAVFEEIGMQVKDPGEIDVASEIEASDNNLRKAVDLMKRAEEILKKAKEKDEETKIKVAIIDSTRDGINWEYIAKKTSDETPLQTLVSRVIESGATLDNCVEKAQAYLSKLMGEVELNASLAPSERDLAVEFGLNEDEISSQMNELENYVKSGGAAASISNHLNKSKLTSKFESADPLSVNVVKSGNRLDMISNNQSMFGRMGDVSTAQLEALDNFSGEVVKSNQIGSQPEVMEVMDTVKNLRWNL